MISSQNNVRKYRTKEYEEVYELVPKNDCFRIVSVLISSETVYSMTKQFPPQLQKFANYLRNLNLFQILINHNKQE